jgi:hypothetical protein
MPRVEHTTLDSSNPTVFCAKVHHGGAMLGGDWSATRLSSVESEFKCEIIAHFPTSRESESHVSVGVIPARRFTGSST